MFWPFNVIQVHWFCCAVFCLLVMSPIIISLYIFVWLWQITMMMIKLIIMTTILITGWDREWTISVSVTYWHKVRWVSYSVDIRGYICYRSVQSRPPYKHIDPTSGYTFYQESQQGDTHTLSTHALKKKQFYSPLNSRKNKKLNYRA